MKLLLSFDHHDIASRVRVHRSPIFGILWEHDQIYYPMKGWTDFGLVILIWWIAVLIRLIEGELEGTFSFMDGPYSIKLKRNPRQSSISLMPSGTDISWSVSLNVLVSELVLASNRVIRVLREMGVSSDELTSLEQGVAHLQNAFAKFTA